MFFTACQADKQKKIAWFFDFFFLVLVNNAKSYCLFFSTPTEEFIITEVK